MSQAVIDTLRAGYEAFNRSDWDAVLQAAPPDFELETADRVISPGIYRGRVEARRFFEDLFEPFDEVAVVPEQFLENGDQIVVLVRVRSRPAGSSAVIENRIAHLWTVRGGAIVRMQIFPERGEALEAAGLAEQDVAT
jgi:ketosteroid isomerase-like protein